MAVVCSRTQQSLTKPERLGEIIKSAMLFSLGVPQVLRKLGVKAVLIAIVLPLAI